MKSRLARYFLIAFCFCLRAKGADDLSRAEQSRLWKGELAKLPLEKVGGRLRLRLIERLESEDPRAARIALEELRLLTPSSTLTSLRQKLEPLLEEEIVESDRVKVGKLNEAAAKAVRTALVRKVDEEFATVLQALTASLGEEESRGRGSAEVEKAYQDARLIEKTLKSIERPLKIEDWGPYINELIKSDLRFTDCIPRSELWQASVVDGAKPRVQSERSARPAGIPRSEWDQWHALYLQLHRSLNANPDPATLSRVFVELKPLIHASSHRTPVLENLEKKLTSLGSGFERFLRGEEFGAWLGVPKPEQPRMRDYFPEDFWDLREQQDAVVIRILPRYLGAADQTPPLLEETPSVYLRRLLSESVARSDWTMVKRILFVSQTKVFDEAVPVRDLAGAQRYLEAYARMEVGRFDDAVGFFLLALHTGSSIVPAAEIGLELGVLREAHPQEYLIGVEKAAYEALVQQLLWTHQPGGLHGTRVFLGPNLLPIKNAPESRFSSLVGGTMTVPAKVIEQ